MSRRQVAARENLMYDVRVCDTSVLDSRVRAWLKRVPLLAIVVLLEAIDDELRSRGRGPRTKSVQRSMERQN